MAKKKNKAIEQQGNLPKAQKKVPWY